MGKQEGGVGGPQPAPGAAPVTTDKAAAVDGTRAAQPAAAFAAGTLDERYAHRAVRYNSSDVEQRLNAKRQAESWNHARANAVYVAAMGNHWRPGAWNRVMDMVHYTNAHGYPCGLEEIMDRCFNPYDALGCMRNEGIMRAKEGWEYILYVDNDVMPTPETLVRLVNRGVPIVAPLVLEPGTNRPLHGPVHQPWTGLHPVRWCVLSMLLIRTNVFNAMGPEFWNDSIGADEGYHFQKLWHYGHQPFLDTDIVLPVASAPTYPLAQLREPKEKAQDFWDARREWLKAAPDRKPIDTADRRVNELGEYLPFMVPAPPGANGQPAKAAPVAVDGSGAIDADRLRVLARSREEVAGGGGG